MNPRSPLYSLSTLTILLIFSCFFSSSSRILANPLITTKKEPRHRRVRAQRRARRLTNQTKTFSKMDFHELKEATSVLLSKGNKQIAAKYIERMISLCGEMKDSGDVVTISSDLMLQLADIHFDLGQFTKAQHLFTQFATLYPGSKNIEYASYQNILCALYATLSAERDQTKTHHTIALADAFIERKDIFTKYLDEVVSIRKKCIEKAIESDVNIFNFYLHRGKIVSAQHRLKNIRTDWLTKYPSIEQQLVAMESQLQNTVTYLAQNNKPLRGRIAKKSKTMLVTQNDSQKKSFVTRF